MDGGGITLRDYSAEFNATNPTERDKRPHLGSLDNTAMKKLSETHRFKDDSKTSI